MDKARENNYIKLLKKLEKAQADPNKGFPVGTKRVWNGNTYIKKFDGNWQYIGDKQDQGNKEEQSEGKLTEKEAKQLKNYTQSEYGQINRYLRDKGSANSSTEATMLENEIEVMKTAISKLPSKNNSKVFRSINIDEDIETVKEKYQNLANQDEDVIQYQAFLSTTNDNRILKNFKNKRKKTNVKISINTKSNNSNAADISDYSKFPEEDEVLFKPNSEFDVVSVLGEDGQGSLLVELQEI